MTGASAPWSAVVVNHNAGELLVACVRSLLEDGAGEVVVVDNASTDGSLGTLAASGLDQVVVVDAAGNHGYASGANLGIGRTQSELVAVLNPDTLIRKGAGAAMAARFADPRVGAVGPRLLNPDGTTYPSARIVPSALDAVGHGLLGLFWPRNRFTRRYRQLDVDASVARDVDWVSGAAVWLRRPALEEVGGWDESYFMYVEDVDLCWRLRRAGWRVVYEPAGEVEHVQGTATARRPYRMLVEHHRSLLRFAAKRWRGAKRLLLGPAALFLTVRVVFTVLAHALRGRSQRRHNDGVACPE